MAALQILGGERAGEIVEFEGDAFSLGRSNDNDLYVSTDARLSRHHARLRRQGSDWLIEDLGSVNGTFVERDGRPERIGAPTPLRDGDVIVTGSLRASVMLEDAPLESFETVVLDALADQTVAMAPELAAQAPPEDATDFERTRVLGSASYTPAGRTGEELVPASAPGLRPARVSSGRREGHRLLATLVVVLPALILALVALYFTGIR